MWPQRPNRYSVATPTTNPYDNRYRCLPPQKPDNDSIYRQPPYIKAVRAFSPGSTNHRYRGFDFLSRRTTDAIIVIPSQARGQSACQRRSDTAGNLLQPPLVNATVKTATSRLFMSFPAVDSVFMGIIRLGHFSSQTLSIYYPVLGRKSSPAVSTQQLAQGCSTDR